MQGERVLFRTTRLCSIALVVARLLGVRSWFVATSVSEVLPWIACALAVKRRRFFEAILFVSMLPTFRLPWGRKDADKISLFHHLFRFAVHGRSDLKLGEYFHAISHHVRHVY